MKIVLIGIIGLVLVGIGGFFYLAHKSKSGVAPGLVEGKLAPCPASPNCLVSEDHADEKHKTLPLPIESWEQIPAAVVATGGVITEQNDSYIAATYTSKTMGFVDDVEFRKSEDAMHIRSASRVGYSDRGANAARIDAIRESLE